MILVGGLTLVVALVVWGLIDSAVYEGKVHAGVNVSGVTLGGLTEDEARAVLARYAAEAQRITITLVHAGRTFAVTPGEMGVQIDGEAALAAAMGVTRDGNFIVDGARRLALYFGDTDLKLAGSVDQAKLAGFLAGVAKAVDIPAVPAGFVVSGGDVRAVQGQKGNVVDRTALSERLSAALLAFQPSEIEIPMMVDNPVELADDTSAALAAAETVISAPVVLTYGERSWTLSAADLAVYLDAFYETAEGASTLVPYLSASKMSPFLSEVAAGIEKKPVDAWFKSNGQMAWVEPGVNGRVVDQEATAEALTAAALETTGRTATLVVRAVEPDLTTAEAEAMGITNKLGGYETMYDCPPERQQNVRVTTEYADALVAPGERYNFDKQIGPRTEARGFALAPGIGTSKTLEDVLGGGICQVSTTVFNAALEAGLEIIERHNHSLYIDHYPPGRDATVTDGGKNFQFRNDTDHWVWVHGWSDGITTRFNIYGTDDGRTVEITWSGWTWGRDRTIEKVVNSSLEGRETIIRRAGQQERSCSITRIVRMPDGTVLHGGPEIYESTFAMITRIIEISPEAAGQTTTTTAPPSTTSTTTAPTTSPTTAPPTSPTTSPGG